MIKGIRIFAIFILIFGGCATTKNELTLSLDVAIQESAVEISNNIRSGTVIAIVNVASDALNVSEYIIEELSLYLPRSKNISVVDRRNLDLIQQEMNFQLSGEVSDESARAIGKKLGAQAIVVGSLSEVAGNYRLRLRAINVETAVIESTSTFTIRRNDRILAELKNAADTQLTTTSTRYVAEDGLFSIDKPEKWTLRNNPFSKYKDIYAIDNGGVKMFINFVNEEYTGTLSEYLNLSIQAMRQYFRDVDILAAPRQFITRSGLRGLRMEITYEVNDIYFYHIAYVFDVKGTSKLLIGCVITLNVDEFDAFCESNERLVDEYWGYVGNDVPFENMPDRIKNNGGEIIELVEHLDDGKLDKWTNIFNEIVWSFNLL